MAVNSISSVSHEPALFWKKSDALPYKITSNFLLEKVIETILKVVEKIFSSIFPHEVVKKEIIPNPKIKVLNEILADHPHWKAEVKNWKRVSLEDKIWMLQLYELHQMHMGQNCTAFTISQIRELFPDESDHLKHNPNLRSLELLSQKSKINQFLDSVDKIIINGYPFKKFTNAICLLKNLKILTIQGGELTFPPNVCKNEKLEYLFLCSSKLVIAPDVNNNPELKFLSLVRNQLTKGPDLSKNPKLEFLGLHTNKLTEIPDLSQNTQLAHLNVDNNEISKLPSFIKNPKLKNISTNNNKLKVRNQS